MPHQQDLVLLKKILLEKSVRFGQFTLSSGEQTDIYIDCKPTTCYPVAMPLIGRIFLQKMKDLRWFPEAVGGLMVGAEPLAFAIARESLDTPSLVNAFIVRKQRKEHGMQKVVEGIEPTEGRNVVVIDDVCTKGGSTALAIENIQSVGMNVIGALCLVDREMGATELLSSSFGIRLESIFTLSAIRRERQQEVFTPEHAGPAH
jgi:orotate phosphoribosyltransferase